MLFKCGFSLDRQSTPFCVRFCFLVLVIRSFEICSGVRRLPVSLSGRFVHSQDAASASNFKFHNEWLAIDKFKDWVARDHADDKVEGGEMYAVYENGANRKRRETCPGKPCEIGSTPKM